MATLDISDILSAQRKSRQMTKLAFARLLVVLSVPFSLRYFYWRAGSTMNPAARWFFYLFLAVELLNFLEALLFYFTTWKPAHHAKPDRLPGRTVDILVATYDEPVHLLRETLVCAVSVQYPHKTYVLDDGNRPEVRALSAELQSPDHIVCRLLLEKKKNLNNALQQTKVELIAPKFSPAIGRAHV